MHPAPGQCYSAFLFWHPAVLLKQKPFFQLHAWAALELHCLGMNLKAPCIQILSAHPWVQAGILKLQNILDHNKIRKVIRFNLCRRYNLMFVVPDHNNSCIKVYSLTVTYIKEQTNTRNPKHSILPSSVTGNVALKTNFSNTINKI